MRDYQRKSDTKYILPRAVYHQTIWRIRDYYRIKETAADILLGQSSCNDGMPKGSGVSDHTARAAIKRERFMKTLKIIDDELMNVPPEYRMGIWQNITSYDSYPNNADRTTYGRYKSKFIYGVAVKLGLY